MAFEEALEEIGGFGLFNKTVLTALVILGTWHVTLGYFGHLFTLLTPASQWCLTNASVWSNFSVTSMEPGECQLLYSSVSDSNVSAVSDKGSTCPTGWMYDEKEIFVTATMENNWLCGNSDKLYTVHTFHWVGSFVGFFVSGFLADRYGRKKTVAGLIAMTIVANLGSVFVTDHIPFAIFRFFVGAGTYTSCTSAFILVMEYTVSSKRTLVAFTWGVSWTVLATLYPWYAYWISDWRGLVISTAALDGVLLVVFWWAPESSSWLLSVGKKKEALALLLRIAKFNGKVLGEERLEHLINKDSEKGLQSKDGLGTNRRGFWRTTFALVATPRIRKHTLIILPVWFMITLCAYVGSLQLGRLGLDVYAVYSVTSAFELPMNIFCILALDRLGRRWPNVAFMFVGGVISIIMAIEQTESDVWTLVMAVLFMTGFNGGFNITFQLASEIFPTVIRGRAVFLQQVMSDLGSVLGTPVAATVEWNKYLPLLIIGILAIVTAGFLLFLPETVGLPLPQTIADGENLAKGRGFCFCPCVSQKGSDNECDKSPEGFPLATVDSDSPSTAVNNHR